MSLLRLDTPKTFDEKSYFWFLDVIQNATAFNDPDEVVIKYIDDLLKDCGYTPTQVYQHILDGDKFIYAKTYTVTCKKYLHVMGSTPIEMIHDFTKDFKDTARMAMKFHPELTERKNDINVIQ